MEEAPLYAKILSYLFIVVYMVSVTMESTQEIKTMLKDRRRMGLALVANLVIVPILAFVLVRLLPLRQDIRIGIMMLAVSPGGLFALQFARISKGDRVFAVALLIVLTLLAIFITPLLAHWLFAQGGRRRTCSVGWFYYSYYSWRYRCSQGELCRSVFPRSPRSSAVGWECCR